MDYKRVAKKYILKNAKNKFPAEELWLNEKLEFFAFENYQTELILTEGNYNINNCTLEFTSKTYHLPDTEYMLNNYLNQKLDEGYECFASELRV
jgi:oligoribonuclease NrnB/cAMP/cGMP phosphodiesterase (DHH superfamily)